MHTFILTDIHTYKHTCVHASYVRYMHAFIRSTPVDAIHLLKIVLSNAGHLVDNSVCNELAEFGSILFSIAYCEEDIDALRDMLLKVMMMIVLVLELVIIIVIGIIVFRNGRNHYDNSTLTTTMMSDDEIVVMIIMIIIMIVVNSNNHYILKP